jgi:cold shock CspA family protein
MAEEVCAGAVNWFNTQKGYGACARRRGAACPQPSLPLAHSRRWWRARAGRARSRRVPCAHAGFITRADGGGDVFVHQVRRRGAPRRAARPLVFFHPLTMCAPAPDDARAVRPAR